MSGKKSSKLPADFRLTNGDGQGQVDFDRVRELDHQVIMFLVPESQITFLSPNYGPGPAYASRTGSSLEEPFA